MTKKTIYKYVLDIGKMTTLSLPDAEVLCVHEQHESVVIWALVDLRANVDARTFWVIGTGDTIDIDGWKYHGTAFVGSFVWHVFEVIGG